MVYVMYGLYVCVCAYKTKLFVCFFVFVAIKNLYNFHPIFLNSFLFFHLYNSYDYFVHLTNLIKFMHISIEHRKKKLFPKNSFFRKEKLYKMLNQCKKRRRKKWKIYPRKNVKKLLHKNYSKSAGYILHINR